MNKKEIAEGINELFAKLARFEDENEVLRLKVCSLQDYINAMPYEERVAREVLGYHENIASQIKDVLMVIREDLTLCDELSRSGLIPGVKALRRAIPVELNIAKYAYTIFKKLL